MKIEAITIGGIVCLAAGIYYSKPRRSKKIMTFDSARLIQNFVRNDQKCRKP